MLPSPKELRELAERIRAAVPHARTADMKQRLAAHVLLLAQVAEQLERDSDTDAFVRRSNIERYERLLAGALDERTRSTVEALVAEDNAAQERQRRQIEAWRRRAEELRTSADNFTIPSAQESLHRAAGNYEQMADHAEALLTGEPRRPGEKAG